MNKFILIVDDDEVLKETLSKTLKNKGYIVKTLSNGSECIKFLEKNKPDLILIDYFMPELDGLKTIEIIQSSNQDIPIIMISSDNIKPKGFLFLRKPFGLDKIVEMVDISLNDIHTL